MLVHLLKPMVMMARPGSLDLSKRYAKTQSELQEIVKDLKIKNYVK